MANHPLQMLSQLLETGTVPPQIRLQAQILLGAIALLWGLELADALIFRGALNQFGIRPRKWIGLRGVLLAPLLHGNLRHLSTNTLPFIVLGWLIMLRSLEDFGIVTAIAWLVSGMGVWLFASPRSNHIGASGLIFGYFGFLLLRGYFERSVVAIAVSILVGLLYGGLVWGILPIRRGMSWVGHLFGFGSGIWVAKYLPELKAWVTQITS